MRSKTGASLILLLTFVLGIVAGVLGHSLFQKRVSAGSGLGNPRSPSHLADELAQGLNMDPAQKEKLGEIIGRSRERYAQLSQQFRPQYEVIRNQTREEIRRILREDQKAKFEQIMSSFEDRHRRRQPGPPPPQSPPAQ